ncbi:MAG TPA: hypothetical protein GXZ47_02345, partial [Treponema sp.]|nr:hypothetical protein [Treponema sp.]
MMHDHTNQRWVVLASLVGGIILLVGAALLAVSILLAIFPLYGTVPFIAIPGLMLFSVYGFSSFLIPLFFLFAAIILAIPGWSPRSSAMLLGSFVPFFTVVGAEKLYRMLGFSGNASYLAPVIGAGIVGTTLLAVVLEYLFFLYIADKYFHLSRSPNFSKKTAVFFKNRLKKIKNISTFFEKSQEDIEAEYTTIDANYFDNPADSAESSDQTHLVESESLSESSEPIATTDEDDDLQDIEMLKDDDDDLDDIEMLKDDDDDLDDIEMLDVDLDDM